MTAAAHRAITVSYAGRSDIRSGEKGGAAASVRLALDGARGEIGLRAGVRDAGLLREALATTVAILGSDLRHKSKDRAAYLAYLAKQGKKANAAIWAAQKAFLDEAFAEDRQKITVLDPVLSVHPDELAIEVFSKDESAYARLALKNELFTERQASCGTTFVDLSPALLDKLDGLRGHGGLALEAAVSRAAPQDGAVEQRALEVPYAWIRGLLQVQSAATLPGTTVELAAIDLYNLLFALRLRKAKKSPRALRFELVPGAAPRLVLEPWEIVLEGHAGPFRGKAPRVVRTFGRGRLMALGRILPYLRSARVHLLGPGLPVFWVLDCGAATLTLGLSGWTESGWSSAASFDSLMPGEGARPLAERLLGELHRHGPQPLSALIDKAGKPAGDVRAAMQLLCLRGQALYDLGAERFRPRDLFAQPIDDALVRYGNPREAQAHRLLESDKAVKLTKIHEIAGEGVEIQGEVQDKQERRSYAPHFLLDVEGRAREAGCSCPLVRRSGLREGPCEHLLALRLRYVRQRSEEEARRQTPEGRRLIRAETRTLVRREEAGHESIYRVSLDDRTVRVLWHDGPRRGAERPQERQQRLWFDSDREAREAYFARLEALGAEGYIDADAF